MSRALDVANDLSTLGPKYDAGNFDAISVTNSVVDAGQLLGIDLSGLANAGDYISVNVSNAQDDEVLVFSSGTLVNQALSSSIDHDALTNFVANEHIDWTDATEDFMTTGTFSSGQATFVNNSTTNDTILLQTSDDSSSAAPILTFDRNSTSPANADYLGQIKFKGNNDSGSEQIYAKITGKISDVTNGTEDGLIEYAVKSGGSNSIVMRITGSALKLLNSTSLEVDGSISTGGTQRVSNSGALSNVTADAAIITSGTFADARISSSSVTQHLSSYLTAESDTLDSVTGRGNSTSNGISVGTLNTHTIPSGTGTLALVGDIPTNNNQLTNGAGYLTAESDTLDSVTGRGNSTSNGISVGTLNTHTIPSGTGTLALEADTILTAIIYSAALG